MPFAVALSEHPIPAHAVGEVIGRVLELGGTGPDLAVLFAGWSMAGALEDVEPAVRELLRPVTFVTHTTTAVVGGGHLVADGRGLALLAGYGFDAEPDDSALGVTLDVAVGTVTSHGCRAVGEPMTVTAAVDDVVIELDGEPARTRVQRALVELDEEDLARATRSILLGDGQRVHRVRGTDRGSGAIALDGPPPEAVSVVVRDDAFAAADLRRRLAGVDLDAALVLADEDRLPLAAVVAEHTDAVAGMAVPSWAPLSVILLRDR